ncbi:MAG: hypothetical protein NVS3B10_30120 [Polyangiales bacterium]
MTDPKGLGASSGRPGDQTGAGVAAADRLERIKALEEFRAEGLLSNAELEEQKLKLHWGSGPAQAGPGQAL